MNENFSNQVPEERPVQLNKQPPVQRSAQFNSQSQSTVYKTNEALSQQANRPTQNYPQNPPQRFPNFTPPVSQINREVFQHPVNQPFQQKNKNVSSSSTETKKSRFNLESIAYYIFLVTAFLTPLAFLPTPYISLGLVKTIIIAVGILAAAVCYSILALKEKSLPLGTKATFWTSLLIVVSLLVSAFNSNHIGKALFGQGFEVGTAGFLIILFIGAWVAYEAVRRDRNRIFTIFSAIGIVYTILALLELLRMIFGPTALSMSILTTSTSTLLGGWYDFGTLSIVMLIVGACALLSLSLSSRAKILYGIVAVLALFIAFIVNQATAWIGLAFVMAIMAIALYRGRQRAVLWLPIVLCVLALVMTWKGATIAGPVITGTNTQYSELSLPWQVTTDIITGTIKNYPLFGIGPNHFTQAYTVFKPIAINQSNAWSVEFNAGFGLIPTFMVTQGSIGMILWILFIIFFGILATRTLKNIPTDPQSKFMVLSVTGVVVLLFLNMILYVPSHAILLFTFIIFGLFIAVAINNKTAVSFVYSPVSKLGQRFVSLALIMAVVLGIIGGLVYLKKFVAFIYFASGVKSINVSQNYKAAGSSFKQAISLDRSDIYLQALSENDRLQASAMISAATTTPSKETTDAIGNLINDGIKIAREAIAYDPTNYYNYVSEARISDLALSIKMANAYENAVRAYTDAINLNPLNPSLYVNLAQSQASNSKFDDALRTIGAALQVKSNYLDAVYLLSQVQAAQGNLKDAIISTEVATQMQPQSSLLFFQLGLLHYNNKNYASSTAALETAIKLTPDYANAKYFLGLSYVRLNRNTDAITLFTDLAKTNPDNKEISFILTNLEAGKSPFADAKPPVTATPETRKTLPVTEKSVKTTNQ